MRIGICGAHRVGKSTLAAAIGGALDIRPLPNPNTAVRLGFDMKNGNRLNDEDGMILQIEILDGMNGRFVGDNYVTDRTPLDAAAYLIADATANAGDEVNRTIAAEYVRQAMGLTEDRFDIVILVPPAIDVAPVDGKPPVNAAYQAHIHLLISGMLAELDLPTLRIEVGTTDHDERVRDVLAFVDLVRGENAYELAAAA
jgi:nicotinamide riboside kinase